MQWARESGYDIRETLRAVGEETLELVGDQHSVLRGLH